MTDPKRDVVPPAQAAAKIIVGIYGISGAGKSLLLDQLKHHLGHSHFTFYEGSQLIASVVPGGLNAFQALDEQSQLHYRQAAIRGVANRDTANEQVAVITGHYMFWKEGESTGVPVITQDDLATYTHIIYLDVPAETIEARRKSDMSRDRPQQSVTHLSKWQQVEKTNLRRLCYDHDIIFSVVHDGLHMLRQVSRMLQSFHWFTETNNVSVTRTELENALDGHQWRTLLVMDADRTLAAVDTGTLFWQQLVKTVMSKPDSDPVTRLFETKGHNYAAFRQAMFLYEESTNERQFDDTCKAVASATSMHPEFVSLLQVIADQDHVGAVIITCGLRRIWEEVLRRHGVSDKVKVIGGGRLSNGYIVTGDTKADLVAQARRVHNAYVCAFGDSPLDLGMLKEANRAIVVVGEEQMRSKSMEDALLDAIQNHGLQAHQAILPNTAKPRLDLEKLPAIQLTESKFIEDVLRLQPPHGKPDIVHATSKNAAKLITTSTRHAHITGPALRKAHRTVGHYLATEYLSETIGIEEITIPHVQGHETTGHRYLHEDKTLIVPLMRGGEPMAFGINDAMPTAMLLHATRPDDIHHNHVHGRLTVILVDSVVNTGKSILEFVHHVRKLHATVRIVVVAGVVQTGAVARLEKETSCYFNVRLVALRLSENKFAGKGGTDTGNRLFNTTHLD